MIKRVLTKTESFLPKPDKLNVPSQGNIKDLIKAIQDGLPHHSRALDHLLNLLNETGVHLTYTELPTVSDFLDYARGKRAFFDPNGNLYFPEGNPPQYLEEYLERINSRQIRSEDVTATVNRAFFVLVHPEKWGRGRPGWASLAHHNFTTYRGDMYGPGWADPRYSILSIFRNRPTGFDINFVIAAGYDPEKIIRRYGLPEGSWSRTTQIFLGRQQMSFSIGEQPNIYYTAYVPIKKPEWRGYDMIDGKWGHGWEVFGVTSNELLLGEVEKASPLSILE